jgi:hypothetical protein
VVTPALFLTACTISSEPESSPAASTSPTPTHGGSGTERVDVTGWSVPRTDFCGALDEKTVEEALGGPVTDTAHYGNGDQVEVRPGYVDVSHEYGCTFLGADGATAKAWVFARPVTTAEARRVVRRERRGESCAFPDPVGFGRPHLTSMCEVPGAKGSGPTARARLEGLFDQSWLACEVADPLDASGSAEPTSPVPRADVLQRAARWCADVVRTIGTAP